MISEAIKERVQKFIAGSLKNGPPDGWDFDVELPGGSGVSDWSDVTGLPDVAGVFLFTSKRRPGLCVRATPYWETDEEAIPVLVTYTPTDGSDSGLNNDTLRELNVPFPLQKLKRGRGVDFVQMAVQYGEFIWTTLRCAEDIATSYMTSCDPGRCAGYNKSMTAQNPLRQAQKEACIALMKVMVEEDIPFDFADVTDYITIDPEGIHDLTVPLLLAEFEKNDACKRVDDATFIIKGGPDEAFFNIQSRSQEGSVRLVIDIKFPQDDL